MMVSNRSPVAGAPDALPLERAYTLLDVHRETVASFPDRLAIDADDGQLTHAELFDAARALAGRLRRRQIGPGDHIGVHVPSGTVDLYVAMLGVLQAGAAYVPVDAGEPARHADAIWREAGAVAVIEPGLTLRELRSPAGARRDVRAGDDAWIAFSGDAEQTPIGVAVTHGAAVASLEAGAKSGRLAARDRVLVAHPRGWEASHAEMWLVWRAGAVLVPAPRSVARGGRSRAAWIAARRVNVVLESASPRVQSIAPE